MLSFLKKKTPHIFVYAVFLKKKNTKCWLIGQIELFFCKNINMFLHKFKKKNKK